MHNYIDYEWNEKRTYRLFTLRRLIADLYTLESPKVFPLAYRFEGMSIVREVAEGSAVVRFNTLANYLTAMRELQKGNNAVMVRDDDYNKIFNQYAKLVTKPKGEEKIYAEPASACIWTGRTGNVLQIDIHYTTGFYTTTLMDVTDYTYDERKDVMALRDEWLSGQDSRFDYCKEQTDIIDSIIMHLTDLHNTYNGQYVMFQNLIEANKAKGFGMCLYKVKYMDTEQYTKAWAREPEDLFNGLLENYKDKVIGIETMGFCPGQLNKNTLYRVIFVNNTETSFVFRDFKQMSEVLAPFIKRGQYFRIEEY